MRSAISLVPFISSEKVKNGMVRASVIVFTIAFLIPVIFLTLKRRLVVWYLLIFVGNSGKGSNFKGAGRWLDALRHFFLFLLLYCLGSGLLAVNEVKHIFLGHTTPFPRGRYFVDVDIFFLCEMSDSWSRQGFSMRLRRGLITWSGLCAMFGLLRLSMLLVPFVIRSCGFLFCCIRLNHD